MMMMMRHTPPFPSDRVAYYFSPVLPAWPWITSTYLTLHHHHCLPQRLGNSTLVDIIVHFLPASPNTDHCDWLLWLALDNTTGQCCTHDARLNICLFNFWTFFYPYILNSLLLLNEHVGHVFYSCLLWSGALSDCNMCPISAFFPWNHCGSD